MAPCMSKNSDNGPPQYRVIKDCFVLTKTMFSDHILPSVIDFTVDVPILSRANALLATAFVIDLDAEKKILFNFFFIFPFSRIFFLF